MKILRYEMLLKNPSNLRRLTGLSVSEFEAITRKARVVWAKHIEAPKIVSGRPWALGTLENHILALLIYFRYYIPHTFLGLMFGVDESVICRSFKRIEPILSKVCTITKTRKLKRGELEMIIVDVTEQAIQRPKKKQKKYFSGKKKRHTLKTEIQVTKEGKIIRVSKPYPGSRHDLEIRKKERPIRMSARVYADSAYQGLQNIHPQACIPYKRSKSKKSLSSFEKKYNR